MEVTEITQIISNLGFPIFISVYMITKLNGTLKELSDGINSLKILVENMQK